MSAASYATARNKAMAQARRYRRQWELEHFEASDARLDELAAIVANCVKRAREANHARIRARLPQESKP